MDAFSGAAAGRSTRTSTYTVEIFIYLPRKVRQHYDTVNRFKRRKVKNKSTVHTVEKQRRRKSEAPANTTAKTFETVVGYEHRNTAKAPVTAAATVRKWEEFREKKCALYNDVLSVLEARAQQSHLVPGSRP